MKNVLNYAKLQTIHTCVPQTIMELPDLANLTDVLPPPTLLNAETPML